MNNFVTHRDNCRGCFSKNIFEFLDLGLMPLAGGFISEDEIATEPKIPLKVYFCKDCGLVQILDIVDPHVLFKNYYYISSVISSLSLHFKEYKDYLLEHYLNTGDGTLLEFGANDGALLQHLQGVPHVQAIGIDPSENVTKMARDKGLNVITDFFTQKSAQNIEKKYGQMDVVTGSNVFAHVDDIHEIIKAAKNILKPDGVFIVEVHYLGDLMKHFQYDTIYHEHLCYYSLTALKNILTLEDMKIVDVQRLAMHGGGIRVVASHTSSKKTPTPAVAQLLAEEQSSGITTFDAFVSFSHKCEEHKKELVSLLTSLKKEGKRIVGYGAPGRGTILLNYCKITTDILDYIVDVSPLRVGKLMPGVHIPIHHVDKIRSDKPDYALIIAWNYADSILQQEEALRKSGTQFITPFPHISVL